MILNFSKKRDSTSDGLNYSISSICHSHLWTRKQKKNMKDGLNQFNKKLNKKIIISLLFTQ